MKLIALRNREPGRGLVHHHQLGAARNRSQNLDALLVGDAEVAHPRGGIDVDASALSQRPEPPALLLGSHPSPSRGLHAEEHVVHHGAVGNQRQFLGNGRDAGVKGVPRRAKPDRPTGHSHRTAVGEIQPRDDLADRGLASTVLADQGVDRAAVDGEVHAVHRLRRSESLGDARQLNVDRCLDWAPSRLNDHPSHSAVN